MIGPRIRQLTGERTGLYSPLGLRLVDDLTGQPPIGRVAARLDVSDRGAWRPTEIASVTTAGGHLVYPGLGRHREPVGLPPTAYRVVVEAEYYRPMYAPRMRGFEFLVHPYNDTNPPAVVAIPTTAFLLPSAGYPFPAAVPVLRGRVLRRSGAPVVDALVADGNRQDVLTDERGEFALPLRWAEVGGDYRIDARDRPSGWVGSIRVRFPGDLSRGHIITIF